jgi:hypothetical protein
MMLILLKFSNKNSGLLTQMKGKNDPQSQFDRLNNRQRMNFFSSLQSARFPFQDPG